MKTAHETSEKNEMNTRLKISLLKEIEDNKTRHTEIVNLLKNKNPIQITQ